VKKDKTIFCLQGLCRRSQSSISPNVFFVFSLPGTGVTDDGQRDESPFDKANIKTGTPLSVYFGFSIVLAFSGLFVAAFLSVFR